MPRRLLPAATLVAAALVIAGCGSSNEPPPNPDMKVPDIPPGRTAPVPDQPGKKK